MTTAYTSPDTPPLYSCSICHRCRPIEDYPTSPKRNGGRQRHPYCRECLRTYNRERHRQRTTAEHRRAMWRKDYGMSEADYAAILKRQKGVCAICRQPETAKRNGQIKALHVDHDHATGKVRGLLCSRCNTALGGFGDDIKRLNRAIRYLRLHSFAG